MGVNFDEDSIVKRSDFSREQETNTIEEKSFVRNPFVFEKRKPFEIVITMEEQFYEVIQHLT